MCWANTVRGPQQLLKYVETVNVSVHIFAVKPVCYVEEPAAFVLFTAELNSENQSKRGLTLQKQVPEHMNNMT